MTEDSAAPAGDAEPARPVGPVGPVDGRKVPRYAGSGSFARLPEIDRVVDYDVAILGIPFDAGTSYRPGARFGPMAVRQASRHLRPGHHVELDSTPFEEIQVVDAGDVAVTPFSIDEAMTQIATSSRELIRGDRKVVAIGGDHTIALPMLRSVVAEHGPVALVHFDAHLDTWNTYFNAPTTHGTIFRRAFEEGLLVEDHSIHVGIRGPLYDNTDISDATTSAPQASSKRSPRVPATFRSTSRSTSTSSTRPSLPAPAPRKWADSAVESCSRCCAG
jgi:agmatinase